MALGRSLGRVSRVAKPLKSTGRSNARIHLEVCSAAQLVFFQFLTSHGLKPELVDACLDSRHFRLTTVHTQERRGSTRVTTGQLPARRAVYLV